MVEERLVHLHMRKIFLEIWKTVLLWYSSALGLCIIVFFFGILPRNGHLQWQWQRVLISLGLTHNLHKWRIQWLKAMEKWGDWFSFYFVIVADNGPMKIVNFTHVQTAKPRHYFRRPWTLGMRVEEELVEFPVDCAKIGYVRTRSWVMETVQQCLMMRGLEITVTHGWWGVISSVTPWAKAEDWWKVGIQSYGLVHIQKNLTTTLTFLGEHICGEWPVWSTLSDLQCWWK